MLVTGDVRSLKMFLKGLSCAERLEGCTCNCGEIQLQGIRGCWAEQTNNPRKIRVLEELGVVVRGRIPCLVKAQAHNLGYLATKKSRMSHMIEEHQLDDTACVWSDDEELDDVDEAGEASNAGRPTRKRSSLRRPHPGRPLIPDPRHPAKQIGVEHVSEGVAITNLNGASAGVKKG